MLHREIPLSKALGVNVREAGDLTVLAAPLGPNTNHKSSAFGGSLYSLAVLAGWAWIWVRMKRQGVGGHIVVAGSEMEYLSAVRGEFRALCEGCAEEDWERAVRMQEKKGKARVTLEVVVEAGGERGAVFVGDYALIREEAS